MQLPGGAVVGGGDVVVGAGAVVVVGGAAVVVGAGGRVVVGLCATRAAGGGGAIAGDVVPDAPADAGGVTAVVVLWRAAARPAPGRCADEQAAARRLTAAKVAAALTLTILDMDPTCASSHEWCLPPGIRPVRLKGSVALRNCGSRHFARHRTVSASITRRNVSISSPQWVTAAAVTSSTLLCRPFTRQEISS